MNTNKEIRSIDVSELRMGHFKRNWAAVIAPVIATDEVDVRMNPRLRRIEVRSRKPDKDSQNKLIRALEYFAAISFGFSADSAIAVLNCPDTKFETFHVEDCKVYNKKDKNRAVGRLIGKKGFTLNRIEKSLGVRMVVKDDGFGLLGSPSALLLAKKIVGKLIRGSNQNRVHVELKTIKDKLDLRLDE